MAPRPYTLIAELTYRCPLHCVYCSNPVRRPDARAELDADAWKAALRDAEGLGVVQVHFTGGEPLLRPDLEQLVLSARELGLYTNLITSGIPLREERLARLRSAGLEHVQLSLQGDTADFTTRFARHPGFGRKLDVARWTRRLDIPLTVNVVLHRGNIDHVQDIVALSEDLGAERLELANTQYLGWALLNRRALLPSSSQLFRARNIAAAARRRLAGSMEVVFVLPDHHRDRPRACMDGWGRKYIVVSPDGLVLPCHAAHTIAGLRFESVRDVPLREAWETSAALAAFRGDAWLPSPCRTCPERHRDFGGCRCQAFHLTGDAGAVDPACRFAPAHATVLRARAEAEGGGTALVQLRYRA